MVVSERQEEVMNGGLKTCYNESSAPSKAQAPKLNGRWALAKYAGRGTNHNTLRTLFSLSNTSSMGLPLRASEDLT